ncbi:GAF domain-containing protein, partial [Amycolatopsis mediterranei]|uniref:GAF domain-containing protein n=1 Tax=Amycolatopsis mediterranei TaxID=33910 RepID=UPI003D9E9B88
MTAKEHVAEYSAVLGELLREREKLLGTLDRVAALHGTARLIRETVGAKAGFVAELDRPELAVIRWMSGTRTDSLQDLEVPVGQGIGGRVLALGRPVKVADYVSSPAITHQFDAQVRGEGLAAMLAVPIVARGETVAIAYAAMREPADFGDDAVRRMEEVAREAGTALHLAKVAETIGSCFGVCVSAHADRDIDHA